MKKRRFGIVAFMCVAILCLGIGFAALTDDLFIDGTLNWSAEAAQKEFNQNVYFSAAAVDSSSTITDTTKVTTAIAADKNSDANDKVTINVAADAFTVVGQKAVIVATIKNDSNLEAAIAVNTAEGSLTSLPEAGDAFAVTYVINDATIAAKTGETASTGTVTITIELKKIPDGAINNAAFAIELVATSVNPAA